MDFKLKPENSLKTAKKLLNTVQLLHLQTPHYHLPKLYFAISYCSMLLGIATGFFPYGNRAPRELFSFLLEQLNICNVATTDTNWSFTLSYKTEIFSAVDASCASF